MSRECEARPQGASGECRMPEAMTDSPVWYAVFPTAWGPMGAVAGPKGLRRVILPHYPADDLESLLTWEHPGVVRDDGRFGVLQGLCRDYFNARPTDFGAVECDLPPEGAFAGKVYRACRRIPYGQTMSYRQLALEVGREDAARAVATMMSKNPIPLVVPCHRVIYSDGRPGGFSAAGGVTLKQRLLDLERRRIHMD
jgi:methylated-DNA-[protein]-cysteine S-methyltransferase